MDNTGIIILAAGASHRLGSPKQLLPYEGKTLLQHIVNAALENVKEHQVVVVLGANHDMVAQSIKDISVLQCLNTDWESGMASSIRLGLKTLLTNFSKMERCFITVCDQPYINGSVFSEMEAIYNSATKGIVAAEYAGTIGVPVLFSKKYFNELLNVTGEQGAKKIINENPDDVSKFIFNQGAIDIDTISDYEKLIRQDD